MTGETSLLAIDVSSYIPHNCQSHGCPYHGSLEEVEVHKTTCKYKGDGEQNNQDNDSGDKDDWV